MSADLAVAFAAHFRLPLQAVEQYTAQVAERCALVAIRYEREGAFSFEQLCAVETLGSEIGAAIISKFPEPGAEPRPTEEDRRRARGIGGPRG